MSKNEIYDITEVCKMLGTTSRTLRFYEEKNIISSTKGTFSSRRCYTQEQLNHIKNVMVLRTIGLSVDTIKQLQENNTDLKSEIITKKAQILALVESKSKELSLLNEALAVVESNDSIFSAEFNNAPKLSADVSRIVKECSYSLIFEEYDTLYKHLSKKMIEYLPRDLLEIKRHDALLPCGEFTRFEDVEQDKYYPNIAYQLIKFTKIGLKIKFVFHNEKIDGLWLSYYEI